MAEKESFSPVMITVCHSHVVPSWKTSEWVVYDDQFAPSIGSAWPGMRPKTATDIPWVRVLHDPCWLQEELRARGEINNLQVENEDFLAKEKKAIAIASKLQEEVTVTEVVVEEEVRIAIVGHLELEEENGGPATFDDLKFQEDRNDEVRFVALLKACAQHIDLHRGIRLHDDILRKGLLQRVTIGSSLVNMYAKCGALTKAQDVFDQILVRDVVFWNALMAGYAQHGYGDEVLKCFEQMQCQGLLPDEVTFLCIIKGCASLGVLEKGQKLHAQINRNAFVEKHTVVGSALLDMYAKCGSIHKAQEVFDEIPARNVVSWNALIAAYVQCNHGNEAFNLFERMQFEGFSPTDVTFLSILKACGNMKATYRGEEVHAKIVRRGLLDPNIIVGTALLDMYAKCGQLEKAQRVFDNLPVRDTVSWNALLTGYAQYEHGQETMNCYNQMRKCGFLPDEVTLACILKACGSLGWVDNGQETHAKIIKEGWLEGDIIVLNALVDMYAKCGLLEKAQDVFDECPVRNVVSWNALLTGYALKGHCEEALNCFAKMQVEGPSPNPVTFICVLKASGSIGALYKGQEVHNQIVEDGSLDKDMVVGTVLVDMYANCGMPIEAQDVFDQLTMQDVVSWNALFSAYGQVGNHRLLFSYFVNMMVVEPDVATFAIVLNMCSHLGLLDCGQWCFETMIMVSGISPDLVHYTCMVDLFSRVGQLDNAIAMIKEMQYQANIVVWHTFLNACQIWGNTLLGRWAFEHAGAMGEDSGSAVYVCLSNVYAAADSQDGWDKRWMSAERATESCSFIVQPYT